MRLTTLLCWLLLSASSPLAAEQAPIFRQITDHEIGVLLTELGYQHETADDGGIVYQAGGFTITAYHDGTSLQLRSVFADEIPLDRINQWNRTYRYAKATVDSQGLLILDSDLSLLGGVTLEAMIAFLTRFDRNLAAFVSEMAAAR